MCWLMIDNFFFVVVVPLNNKTLRKKQNNNKFNGIQRMKRKKEKHKENITNQSFRRKIGSGVIFLDFFFKLL